jgi:hypothetical protein
MSDSPFKYKAFISYSHQDAKWGDWLHKALETYNIPKAIRGKPNRDGKVPDKLFPIFRDREELPTATDLGAVISNAIEGSAYLIVICSPRSAKSMWVNQEIINFKRLGRENRVLAIIVDGEPNGIDKPGMEDIECFPEALKYVVGEDGELSSERTEPIAADAREGKDGKKNALVKLLAGLLGVNYDDLKQREKKRQQQRKILTTVAATVALAIGYGYWQYAKSIEEQRLITESHSLAVQSQEALKEGDSKKAIELAIAGLPDDLQDPNRPWVEDAENALSQAMYQHKERYSLLAHQGKTTHVVADPKGDYFVTAGDDRKIKQWRVSDRKLMATFEEHQASFLQLAHHPSRPILVSWDSNAKLILRNMENGKEIASFQQYASVYDKSIVWSSNGRYLLANYTAWDLDLNQAVNINFSATANEFESSALVAIDNSEFFAAVSGGKFALLDLENKTELATLAIPETIEDSPGSIRTLSLVNQGKQYLATYQYGQSYLFNAETGAFVKKLDATMSILLDSDRENNVLYFNNYQFKLWDPVSDTINPLKENAESIIVSDGVTLLAKQTNMAMVTDKNDVRFYDLTTGNMVQRFETGLEYDRFGFSLDQVNNLQSSGFDAANSIVNLALMDGRIRAFSLEQSSQPSIFSLGASVTRQISSKNKRFFATWLADQSLKLIDVDNRNIVALAENLSIDDFIFANNARHLVTISNNRVTIYNTDGPVKPKTLLPFGAEIKLKNKLLVSNSSNKIAVLSDDNQLATYDLVSNKLTVTNNASGLQAINNVSGDWLTNTANLKITKYNKELKQQEQVVLENMQLSYFFNTTASFSDNFSHAILINKNGHFEYRNLLNKEPILSIKVGEDGRQFSDLTTDGHLAIIGNREMALLVADAKNIGSKKISPRIAEDSTIVSATFNKTGDQIAVIETQYISEDKYETTVYQLAVEPVVSNKNDSDNAPDSHASLPDISEEVWRSNKLVGKYSVVKNIGEHLVLKSSDFFLIFDRTANSIHHLPEQLNSMSDKVIDIDEKGNNFIIKRDGKLILFSRKEERILWEKEIYSQGFLKFSNDGRYIANALNFSNRGTIEVIDTSNGEVVATNNLHKGIFYGFDQTDKIITWQNNAAICKWNWQTIREIGYRDKLEDKADCAKEIFNNGQLFSKGETLLSVNYNNSFRQIDPIESKLKGQLDCDIANLLVPLRAGSVSTSCFSKEAGYQFYNFIESKNFSPFSDENKLVNFTSSYNGEYLVGLDDKNNINFADLSEKGKSAASKIILTSKDIGRYEIDDSGRFLAILKSNWTLELWDIDAATLKTTYKLPEDKLKYLGQLNLFVTEQQEVLLIFSSGDIYLKRPNQNLSNFKIDAIGNHSPVRIDLDGHRLVQKTYDSLQFWDWSTGKMIAEKATEGYLKSPADLKIHKSTSLLSVKSEALTFYDLETGELVGSIALADKANQYTASNARLVFSGDSSKVAILPGGNVTELQIWDVATTSKISEVAFSDPQSSFLFGKNNQQLWVVDQKGVAKLWKIENPTAEIITRKILKDSSLVADTNSDWLIEYNNNWQGDSILVQHPINGSSIDRLKLSTASNGYYRGAPQLLNVAKISPDGRYMLTRESEYKVFVYDFEKLAVVRHIESELGAIDYFDFSRNSEQILTTTVNGGIQSWNVASGRLDLKLALELQTQNSGQSTQISTSQNGDILSANTNKMIVWHEKRNMPLGESSIPKDTIVSQLTSDGSSVMLINRNGIINYFSLQPKGQDLIDKAKNLVETNTQLQ